MLHKTFSDFKSKWKSRRLNIWAVNIEAGLGLSLPSSELKKRSDMSFSSGSSITIFTHTFNTVMDDMNVSVTYLVLCLEEFVRWSPGQLLIHTHSIKISWATSRWPEMRLVLEYLCNLFMIQPKKDFLPSENLQRQRIWKSLHCFILISQCSNEGYVSRECCIVLCVAIGDCWVITLDGKTLSFISHFNGFQVFSFENLHSCLSRSFLKLYFLWISSLVWGQSAQRTQQNIFAQSPVKEACKFLPWAFFHMCGFKTN